MIIIPAIDIKGGKVVRLWRGDFDKQVVYSNKPVDVAKSWKEQGACTLHIVDLDGALTGACKNLSYVKEIVRETGLSVELGGGIRTIYSLRKALDCGIKRAILGTRAYMDEYFVKRITEKYGEKIAVSVDAVKGKVAQEGWTVETTIDAKELISRMGNAGVKTIIYTDILKDGTMEHPNIEAIQDVLEQADVDIIISGGISSLEDIKAIKALNRKNLAGIIIGKALYEKAIDFKEAQKVAQD